MSLLTKSNAVTLGITIIGSIIGCLVAPKVMGMLPKKVKPVVVSPIIDGEEVG